MDWIEILGYAASLLIAASLTMNSLARLRAINMTGAALLAVYGGLVGAYPVLALNTFTALVNLVYLLRMRPGRSEAFELLAVDSLQDSYAQRFLAFHREDIARFFPDFAPGKLTDPRAVFILRDMRPVGLVVCEPLPDRTLAVRLDYVVPAYRDFRCAQYFYRSWGSVVGCPAVQRFVARGGVDRHRAYLRRVGFEPAPDLGPDMYARPA